MIYFTLIVDAGSILDMKWQGRSIMSIIAPNAMRFIASIQARENSIGTDETK